MRETVFDSGDLPAEHRFEAFRELTSRTHAPTEISSGHVGGYRVRTRVLELGPVRVWPTTVQPTSFRRTPRLIRRSDPEAYHLSLVVRGTGGALGESAAHPLRPENFHTTSTSLAHELRIDESSGEFTAIGLEVPHSAVPLPRGLTHRVLGRPMSGRTGIGLLLAGFLRDLTAHSARFTEQDGPRLGVVLGDLVAALLAGALEAESRLPAETRRRTLLLAVLDFIRRHLGDPALTPSVIAAAHHISLSHLHALFQEQGTTVSGWIRGQRVEGARRDLADPAQLAVPIHRVAARWGFPNPVVFARAFRTAHGTTPSEYRGAAAGPGPQGDPEVKASPAPPR